MGKVVGLVGAIASGKSVLADRLVDVYGASYYRFSDVLRDVLERLHLENTRENLQCLGIVLRQGFGEDVLSDALREDIAAEEGLVVVDGIRYLKEYEMIRELGGVVVYVEAPEKLRYERVVSRASRGEGSTSFEEFLENESKPTEKQISEVGVRADYVIENTGTLEELLEKVDELASKLT